MFSPQLLLAQQESLNQPYFALSVSLLIGFVILLVVNYSTQTGVIARATTKETFRQPIFILMCMVGIMVMVANYFIPFFTMGEDTKVYIDCGLATVLISTLLLTVWIASLSVAEEIEGRTAMTLLSKPINRRQFVLGKYIGILQSSLLMLTIMGFALFILTYFKFGYDQQEAGKMGEDGQPLSLFYWKNMFGVDLPFMVRERFNVARTVLPGLVLIAMEVAVMTAVSVAISTRMPMLVNISTCFAVFVIGHLTPVLVASDVKNVFVKFVARLLATLLPGLDHFNMQAAVSTGKNIPPEYLGQAALYCAAYVIAMIMVAFLMFEDRDLA